MKVVTKLKEIIEGQREQIRRNEKDLHENQNLIESVSWTQKTKLFIAQIHFHFTSQPNLKINLRD